MGANCQHDGIAIMAMFRKYDIADHVVSEMLGVSISEVDNIFRRRRLSDDLKLRVSIFLGLPITEIFGAAITRIYPPLTPFTSQQLAGYLTCLN